ncbi:hypothetical protein [Cytobacillus gottheilii]|uniref:Permease n=1 Tax=Cytobacillus gottheilii TaxID=859144 RepID=A0ABX8FHP0_9BACI|nr:hypothetical protein [Cytobacillus gottheilii]QVY63549.1 hypothetical protein J1899_11085 [Cytobacillus gottheilii]
MERFDFSFNNKYVRWWFIIMLPLIILFAILAYILPNEDKWMTSFLTPIGVLLFFIWVRFDKRKNNKGKSR